MEDMRAVALGANSYHISKWIKQDPGFDKYNNPEFIEKAAKWNFRTYGFGYVSLDHYLEHLEKKRTGRLR